jgi:Transposase DDE domain
MPTDLAEELVADDWEIVREFLPPGWEEQARKTGAWRRSGRKLAGPDALLRILMIHLAAGHSLKETATRARQAGLGELSAVAIHKRLLASEEWLRWLAAKERALLLRKTPKKMKWRLRAVDATTVSEPGSTGTDWRLHYAIDLTNLQCDFFELTDVHGGETWRRVPVESGDVLLGDRIYSNPVGVAHVLRAGGDVLVRLNPHTLPLYGSAGTRLNVLGAVRGLKVGQHLDLPAAVKSAAGETFAGRLVALRRSAAATRREQRRLQRKASKQQKSVTSRRLRWARYLLIWTTLPAAHAAADITEFYRWRWQIELGFKRMKSILGLGHLPKKDPASARAWLHGKLLTSLLVERMIQAANTFSPWGY